MEAAAQKVRSLPTCTQLAMCLLLCTCANVPAYCEDANKHACGCSITCSRGTSSFMMRHFALQPQQDLVDTFQLFKEEKQLFVSSRISLQDLLRVRDQAASHVTDQQVWYTLLVTHTCNACRVDQVVIVSITVMHVLMLLTPARWDIGSGLAKLTQTLLTGFKTWSSLHKLQTSTTCKLNPPIMSAAQTHILENESYAHRCASTLMQTMLSITALHAYSLFSTNQLPASSTHSCTL